jgi:hypothetical protein
VSDSNVAALGLSLAYSHRNAVRSPDEATRAAPHGGGGGGAAVAASSGGIWRRHLAVVGSCVAIGLGNMGALLAGRIAAKSPMPAFDMSRAAASAMT